MLSNEAYRRNAIDYAKALGIIVVVIGHCSNNIFNVMTPYMYHMPMFFIIGGMVFNVGKPLKKFLGDIFTKFIVYIAIADIFLLFISYMLQNYFGISGLYKHQEKITDYIVYSLNTNMHVSFLFLVSWFMFAYACGSIILYAFMRVINNFNEKSRLTVSTITILLSGYLSVDVLSQIYRTEWNIAINYASQTCFAFSFMLIGKTFKEHIYRMPNLVGICACFLLVLTMKRTGFGGEFGTAWSSYKHGFVLTYIQAILCSYIVISIACLLARSASSKTFILIGRESKSIMTFHLLAFVICDIFFSKSGLYDLTKTKALTHYAEPTYWPIYIMAGIFFPISLSKALHISRSRMKSIFKS